MRHALLLAVLTACLPAAAAPWAAAQAPAAAPPPNVERIGPDQVRVGTVTVNTARRELVVSGAVTDAQVLEFVATRRGGNKSYESALELDTDVIAFNVALILIGLDPERGVPTRMHIDPSPPAGDLVEIWVEWTGDSGRRRVRAEELVYNSETKQTLTEGPWVYTGSMESPLRDGRLFAEVDGTLIGFVHTPSPLIESPRPLAKGDYGANRINPALNLKPGTEVAVSVRALPRGPAASGPAR